MTNDELLEALGEAEDFYVLEARKDAGSITGAAAETADSGKSSKKKKGSVWPVVLIACLLFIVLVAGGGFVMTKMLGINVTGLLGGGTASAETVAAEAEDSATDFGITTMQAPTEEAAEAAEPEAAPEAATEEASQEDELIAEESVEEEAVVIEEAEAEDAEAEEEETSSDVAWQTCLLAVGAKVKTLDDPDSDDEVSDSTADAINSFAYETAAEILSAGEGNTCFSPLGLYHALTIATIGAEGDTQDQLLEALDADDAELLQEDVEKSMIYNTCSDTKKTVTFTNSIWLSNAEDVSVQDEWIDTAAAELYADVGAVDYSASNVSSIFGNWVADKTDSKMKNFGDEVETDENSAMTVLSTVLYDTSWKISVNKRDTTTDTFTTSDGTEVTCSYIHLTDEDSRAVRADGYNKSRIFLSSGRIIIVLPDEGVDVEDLLTEEKLEEIFEDSDYQSTAVEWSIPKFQADTEDADMTGLLKKLGVTDALSAEDADFSGIAEGAYLSAIRQSTTISLSESGIVSSPAEDSDSTKTDAATDAEDAEEEEEEEEEESSGALEMNLNRPFLFIITAEDGSTLYMGIVRNPVN